MIISGLSVGGHVVWRKPVLQHPTLLLSTLLVVVLIINEAWTCAYMMQHAQLPYHVFVECAGYVAFDALSNAVLAIKHK